MRILYLLTIVGILLLVGSASGGEVKAQWVTKEDHVCHENFEIQQSSIKGDTPQHPRDESIANIRSHNLCSKVSNLEIWWVSDSSVNYCPENFVIPKDRTGRYHSICCPVGYPLTGTLLTGQCCPERSAYVSADGKCRDINDDEILDRESDSPTMNSSFNDLNSPFVTVIDVEFCAHTGCLLLDSKLLDQNTSIGDPRTLGLYQNEGYECFENLQPLDGKLDKDGNPIPSDMVCSFQRAVPAEVANLGGGVSSCGQIKDEDEQARCYECIGRNVDDPDSSQTFIYSSIGCIDTRRDPIITRIFQIGFGLLSGFGVIKIMMAAVKLQSSDPAKHQEARDDIIAVIAALATLGAAIPLLQYIGINILNLLPFNFLN